MEHRGSSADSGSLGSGRTHAAVKVTPFHCSDIAGGSVRGKRPLKDRAAAGGTSGPVRDRGAAGGTSGPVRDRGAAGGTSGPVKDRGAAGGTSGPVKDRAAAGGTSGPVKDRGAAGGTSGPVKDRGAAGGTSRPVKDRGAAGGTSGPVKDRAAAGGTSGPVKDRGTAGGRSAPVKDRGTAASGSSHSHSLTAGDRAGPAPPDVQTVEAHVHLLPPTAADRGAEPTQPPHKGSDKEKRVAASSSKPQPAVKKKKRRMGLYDLVPRKKTKAQKQQEEKPETVSETVEPEETSPARDEAVMEATSRAGGGRGANEYTELALDSLDLKAQEELLSGGAAAVADSQLAEDLPLCCCRMETPPSGAGPSAGSCCMAVERTDGELSCCQRHVIKQELMRPSNTVQLLLLCEDHRAGMVKHQCCPGCGLFCRGGSFMECRPYGGISHRFHRECASILRNRSFCPHCGEDASGAFEVTAPKPDPPQISIPRTNSGPALPAGAALLPPPKVLRAKKSTEPHRGREHSPNRSKVKADGAADRLCEESLENILIALDDENLEPKKVSFPSRQLYTSAQQGELQKVIHLLVHGKDPNLLMEDQHRRSPLHAAAAEGHQEVCHMLLQAGANLDMVDEELRTPLMLACHNNHLETVKYLLRAGAAISHKDLRGFTCLHVAAKLGHYDIIHHLISKAPQYIDCQDGGGWTPITWAIEYKHRQVFQLLLSRGADVNLRDKEQNVCLHWAALSGCSVVAQALLDAHCQLDAINVHGDSPLHVAARGNQQECVTLFVSHGADVSQRNMEGQSALDCCVYGSRVWAALSTSTRLLEARRGRQHPGCAERVLSRDISRGFEAVPITCVNGVDGEPCPENFQYVADNCVTSALSVDTDITHLQHCSCTDDCSSITCMCAQLSLQCWYDNEGRLPLAFSQQEPPVLFECNQACSCWRTCRNRVVQKGLRTRLQVFRTQKMGWGVRALQDVPQGTFICEYAGEIISDAEANRRESDSFLFTLDNKVGDIHCIDARLFGNIGRFINHLCEANLLAVRVFTTHQDLRFPRVAFFSSRAIKAGEQLGLDYGDHYWRVKRKYFSCQCGSLSCRHSSSSSSSPGTEAPLLHH